MPVPVWVNTTPRLHDASMSRSVYLPDEFMFGCWRANHTPSLATLDEQADLESIFFHPHEMLEAAEFL